MITHDRVGIILDGEHNIRDAVFLSKCMFVSTIINCMDHNMYELRFTKSEYESQVRVSSDIIAAYYDRLTDLSASFLTFIYNKDFSDIAIPFKNLFELANAGSYTVIKDLRTAIPTMLSDKDWDILIGLADEVQVECEAMYRHITNITGKEYQPKKDKSE